jgi:hypothetical protein
MSIERAWEPLAPEGVQAMSVTDWQQHNEERDTLLDRRTAKQFCWPLVGQPEYNTDARVKTK